MYTTTTYESLRLLLLECVLLLYRHSIRTRPGPFRAGTVPARKGPGRGRVRLAPAPCRHGVRTRTRPGPGPGGAT